jgi:hypothetical protein
MISGLDNVPTHANKPKVYTDFYMGFPSIKQTSVKLEVDG